MVTHYTGVDKNRFTVVIQSSINNKRKKTCFVYSHPLACFCPPRTPGPVLSPAHTSSRRIVLITLGENCKHPHHIAEETEALPGEVPCSAASPTSTKLGDRASNPSSLIPEPEVKPLSRCPSPRGRDPESRVRLFQLECG